MAARLGITVLLAYPIESEVPLEFAGLADLLETVWCVVAELPGPQRQAILQAVLLVEPSQGPTDPRTVAKAVLTLLRKLAGNQPVLIVVDDLPWLDAPSAQALSYALRRLRHEPMGLLAAVRTGWSEDRPTMVTDNVPAETTDYVRLGPLSLAAAGLGVGIQAGLVTETGGDVAFVHPLVRSLVAEQAQSADRRAAHRRLAAVVTSPEARARHVGLGAEGPDETVAGALEAAARLAGRRGASDTAADLLELAAALTPLDQRDSQQRRTVLAAEERFEASDPARACRLLENIIDTVPAGPARAELLLRRVAWYRAFYGERIAAWTASLRYAFDEARNDTALQAVIMMDQAEAASRAGNFREAIRSAETVLELACEAGDEALGAQGCAVLAAATFRLGNGLRPDLISRAFAGPPQSPRLSMELRPNVVVGHILHWTDNLDGARVLYEQEYDRAAEQGLKTGLPFVLWALAENEGWAGNWARAEHLAADGYSLAEDSGSPAAMAFMLAVRGLMHAYRGRIDAGLNDAARAVELAREIGMPLAADTAAQAFGIATLSVGDPGRAHERLRPFAEAIRATGVAEPALCRFLPDEVEALTRLGELGTAEALLGPFETRSAQLGRSWGMATAGRCRGLLLAATGDLAGGVAALEAALEVHRRLAMPFDEARTLLAAGEVHRRARHKRKALVYLQTALAIFERLGAPQWQLRVCDELARVGTHAAPLGNGPVLTAAEQRVAELVAAGRSNSEIAAELFMGLRTVEAHLSRTYRKLSVRSRTELCRMLTATDQPRGVLTSLITGVRASGSDAATSTRRRGDERSLSRARSADLTAVEHRVAELAAAGRTSREIAAELFMGLRTVEAHLTSVFGKLGVRRRGQLAPALQHLSPREPVGSAELPARLPTRKRAGFTDSSR